MHAIDLTAAIQQIESMGIPTNSYTEAAIHLNGLGQPISAEKVEELIGVKPHLSGDVNHDRLLSTYIVYTIIETKIRSLYEEDAAPVPDGDLILRTAMERTTRFMKECAWTFMGDNQEAKKAAIENADPEQVKAGRAKKGAKKYLGLQVFKEQINGKDLKRKEAIEILMSEVGLTKAGASTYYANFKSGMWA